MFAHIIPYSTSFSTEALTYSVGDSFVSRIQIGQMVEIPYGKKTIFGIVANIFSSENIPENIEIKQILQIVHEIPILSQYQIQTICRIALKYILPIHKVLSIFLSESIIKRLQKYQFPLQKHKKNQHIPQHFDIFLTKNDIISPEKIEPFLKNSLVIILPDDILLETFRQYYQWKYGNKIAFFPNDVTETKRAQAFIDIFNKKSEIIIWTRRLIQYNLYAYDEIWYVEDSFSQDYYHYPTRIAYTDFLAHLVNSEQFSVKIFSSIPQLSTLSKFHFFTLHHF